MLNLIHPQAHKWLFYCGLLLVVIGIGFNHVVTSIGTIWLFSNVVLEGGFKKKWRVIKTNRALSILLIFVAYTLIRVFFSIDIPKGVNAFITRLPYWIIPLSLLLSKPHFDVKPLRFVGSVFIIWTIVISIKNYLFLTDDGLDLVSFDYRAISTTIAHNRFSIIVACAGVFPLYFTQSIKPIAGKVIWGLCAIWLGYYTVVSQSFSGMFFYICCTVAWCLNEVSLARKSIKYAAYGVFGLIVTIGTYRTVVTFQEWNSTLRETNPEISFLNVNGRILYHAYDYKTKVNGNFVFSRICKEELIREWPKYSDLPYKDISPTLFRYMTTMDLPKDSFGLAQLSETNIQEIEAGIPSPDHVKGGYKAMKQRIEFDITNYLNSGNIKNSSLLRRVEHNKAGLQVFKTNPVFGIGIGEWKSSYVVAYDEIDSGLPEPDQLRAHNQFLSIGSETGIVGLLIMIGFIVLLFQGGKSARSIFTLLSVGILCTWFMEDTLETQMGATLFGLIVGFQLSFKDKN